MRSRPHRHDSHSSDSETSDVSFQMDSDPAATNSATDVSDLDAPPAPSRDAKPPGCGRRQRRRGRACVTQLTGPIRPSAASATAQPRVSGSATTKVGRINKKSDQNAAFQLDEGDFSESSEDEDSDSDSDPEVETDHESSDDEEDDGYAESTKEQREKLRGRWERFCRRKRKKARRARGTVHLNWQHPVAVLRVATRRILTEFFRFCLRLSTGKDGRKLPGIGKLSSLGQDWKSFLRYYEAATGSPLDEELGRKMNKRLRKLALTEFELDTDEKEKTPMYIEDLVPLQETVLRTQEKRFWLGLQRIQQCLYNVMACFTVNRIDAMRNLQYKHLQCSMQRDPRGGPPLILLEITNKFAKKHMGVTQANTFVIPEILYDPSLMLSPHSFLLGILLRNEAFRAPNLRSMEDLRRLFIGRGRQQLPLPLKPEMADYYVFCRVEAKRGKVTVNPKLPITKATLTKQIRDFGEIAGFPWAVFTHRFRYGGGTIINPSGKALTARIHVDMQALMRGLEPDSELMRAVTRMGRWMDPRRPRELTDEQKASVEDDPELVKVIEKRDRLALELQSQSRKDEVQLARLKRLKKAVTNTRQRLLYALRSRIRREFDDEQAVIDIEQQLAGTAVADDETKEMLQNKDRMPPELVTLNEKLMTWPTSDSIEAEWRRRNEAVEAVRIYCDVLEGGPPRGRRPQAVNYVEEDVVMEDAPVTSATALSERDRFFQAAEEHIRMASEPLCCFQCFADPGQADSRRLKHYPYHRNLVRHFRDWHVDDRRCNFCGDQAGDFQLEMHWKAHVSNAHRLLKCR
uniref:Uncharacterized protein n=1 Tax=Talaromyces marneffei PM1 TaxID=1077442 RepID=A0A093UP37_TALMA